MGRHRCLSTEQMMGLGLNYGQRKRMLGALRVIKHQLSKRQIELARETFADMLQDLDDEFLAEQTRPDDARLYSIGLDERCVEILEDCNINNVGELRRWVRAGMNPRLPRIGVQYERKILQSLEDYDLHYGQVALRTRRLARRRLDS